MATVEEKLQSLWNLQSIDGRMDKLQSIRGELPMEVADLEDEIAGLQTRLDNFEQEIGDFESGIVAGKEKISESQRLSKKYNEQLNKVKNNREYDALNKEIEIQGLEVLAAEKKIGELQRNIVIKQELIDEVKISLDGRRIDLENKKKELEDITSETGKEESKILKDRDKALTTADPKLLKAYDRIRKNVLNGLAVAPVLRGSCGGCFAKVPPQLQSDIRQRKKIVICEHCGRINVDADLAGIVEEVPEEKPKSRRRKKA
ncbi:MAG: putative nucleic acid-binding Zn-ribbon protein [Bacteroidia bacterium]|jgi:predicted  nucleic acid-binding Zn-ribbon protein